MRNAVVAAVAAAGLSYASAFIDDMLCVTPDGVVQCPASAGCCSGGCCGFPRPPTSAPSGFSYQGYHFMQVAVGVGFFIVFCCMIVMCVCGVIRACKRRHSAAPFEAYPAAPYPAHTWTPAPAPVPTPMGGVWSPAPMPTPVHVDGAGAWQPAPAPKYAPGPASADDPPPPYHTVVTAGPPPC